MTNIDAREEFRRHSVILARVQGDDRRRGRAGATTSRWRPPVDHGLRRARLAERLGELELRR